MNAGERNFVFVTIGAGDTFAAIVVSSIWLQPIASRCVHNSRSYVQCGSKAIPSTTRTTSSAASSEISRCRMPSKPLRRSGDCRHRRNPFRCPPLQADSPPSAFLLSTDCRVRRCRAATWPHAQLATPPVPPREAATLQDVGGRPGAPKRRDDARSAAHPRRVCPSASRRRATHLFVVGQHSTLLAFAIKPGSRSKASSWRWPPGPPLVCSYGRARAGPRRGRGKWYRCVSAGECVQPG